MILRFRYRYIRVCVRACRFPRCVIRLVFVGSIARRCSRQMEVHGRDLLLSVKIVPCM